MKLKKISMLSDADILQAHEMKKIYGGYDQFVNDPCFKLFGSVEANCRIDDYGCFMDNINHGYCQFNEAYLACYCKEIAL